VIVVTTSAGPRRVERHRGRERRRAWLNRADSHGAGALVGVGEVVGFRHNNKANQPISRFARTVEARR
jgi:hypothetical protein